MFESCTMKANQIKFSNVFLLPTTKHALIINVSTSSGNHDFEPTPFLKQDKNCVTQSNNFKTLGNRRSKLKNYSKTLGNRKNKQNNNFKTLGKKQNNNFRTLGNRRSKLKNNFLTLRNFSKRRSNRRTKLNNNSKT